MRTETEMMSIINKIGFQDERIRAAYIEGSRVNTEAPKDIFQDYDIVYVVEDTRTFREDKEWIKQFGKILYMQFPEDNVFYPSDTENYYGWQIQFWDGNRLDLHVCTKEYALNHLGLYRILIDKDGILPEPKGTAGERYWVAEPREEEFLCTCSEFWWCLNNVAKGLWRNEIPYAMDVINYTLRPQLRRLLEWKIGLENRFCVNVGKSGKYLKKYLSENGYKQYLATYSIAETEEVWNSVFAMCDLFQNIAVEFSKKMNFSYDFQQAENSLLFLKKIRILPADAREINLQ